MTDANAIPDGAGDSHPITREMAGRLKAIPERGFRQYCDCCGQRNSIGNLFFCLRCGEIKCWRCIGDRADKMDKTDGQRHTPCRCGDFLKSHDDWLRQAQEILPGDFPPQGPA